MRSPTEATVCVIACAALSIGLAAQEGHPLAGTWSGDWGATADKRTRITLVMTWDGKSIAGTINPGPEAMTLGRVTVDYAKWTVRIEADGKDSSGKPVRVLADGKIYCVSEEGTATTVKAGPSFEVLGVSKLDDQTLASPVAVENQIFIRTADYLYCIQKR